MIIYKKHKFKRNRKIQEKKNNNENKFKINSLTQLIYNSKKFLF